MPPTPPELSMHSSELAATTPADDGQMADGRPPTDLDAKQDEVLKLLDELNRQIEAVIDRARRTGPRLALGVGRSFFGEDCEIVGPIVHEVAPWLCVFWR